MECGEQCVIITGMTMMPGLCADSWGTVSMQVKLVLGQRSTNKFQLVMYLKILKNELL